MNNGECRMFSFDSTNAPQVNLRISLRGSRAARLQICHPLMGDTMAVPRGRLLAPAVTATRWGPMSSNNLRVT
ncbi:hypothetical protein AAFF_G00408040 [Aldrovandia affinis]|uniref:Uncharacterized protein n=1 Tax=Aldrovandia affinis TaxID=143900 RepID=A0AAD7SBT3_9TELE|nr:hypothetical protein AAFF_G00408040 [Aldrovandia affinis]